VPGVTIKAEIFLLEVGVFVVRKVSRVQRGLLVFGVFFALCVATLAYAEPERYDFPVLDRRKPVKLIFPSMPKEADFAKTKEGAPKRNDAKRKSIASLLRKYNKKLNNQEAYNYAIFIIQASEKFGQNPFVIASMVVTESSARYDAVSKGGDYGLMQVRWRVHGKKIKSKYPHIAKAKDMLNPKNNLLVGTEIFSTYHATAKKDVRQALMYYSAGNKRMAEKVITLASQLEKSYQEHLANISS
jgi:soluble lytic murein transglycosylase-like protein